MALRLCDYQDRLLLPYGDGDRAGEPAATEAAGRAMRERVAIEEADRLLHVPLGVRGDVLGVLTASFPDSDARRAGRAACERAAVEVAHAVLAAGRCSDLPARARRAEPLGLAAELQWDLLPLRSCRGARFHVAGWLEPAYDVGGDSFDYAAGDRTLDLAIVDAMGHALPAALTSTLAVNALRNARRARQSLAAQASSVNAAVHGQHTGSRFVTALLGALDLEHGALDMVVAGHPAPWLVRAGRARPLDWRADLPLGLFDQSPYQVRTVRLEPRDRLVLVSDGAFETRDTSSMPFGEERLGTLLGELWRRDVRDAVRSVAAELLDHAGQALQDDVSVLAVDWLP